MERDHQLEHFYNRDTFDNQKQFGRDIYDAFKNRNLTHVLAIAPTQSGKTGSMLAIAREFNQSKHMQVPIDNIFIFTGHSSTEWTTQTKQRFPRSMSQNILHRNNAKQFIQKLHNTHNALIIFDESHIANKFGQTLFTIYHELGFFDISSLYRRNIKIIHFTATPNSLLPHVHRWHNSMVTIHMQVPPSYISAQHYFENNQIFQCKPLHDNHANIRELVQVIDLDNPYYHIIRTPRGRKHFELIQDFKLALSSFDFEFISEPSFRKQRLDIYSSLLHKPKRHTFIFIIDVLRCAKSIHVQHVQIFYERFVFKPNHDSILQGLLGRCTGYHSHHSHIRIFTFYNIQHIYLSYFNILFPTSD